jgi:hypothetical protein
VAHDRQLLVRSTPGRCELVHDRWPLREWRLRLIALPTSSAHSRAQPCPRLLWEATTSAIEKAELAGSVALSGQQETLKATTMVGSGSAPRGGDEQLEMVAEPKLEEDTVDLHTDAQDGSPLVRSLSGRRIRDTKNDCVASDVSSGLWVS